MEDMTQFRRFFFLNLALFKVSGIKLRRMSQCMETDKLLPLALNFPYSKTHLSDI